MEYPNWQILTSYTYSQDAHMAKVYLESEGIEVNLKDELTAQVDNFHSNAIGGIKIMVLSGDFERSVEALKKGGFIKESDLQKAVEAEILSQNKNTDKSTCPYCQSKKVGRKKEADALASLLYPLLGVFFPIFRRAYECADCKKVWKYQ